MAQFAIDEVLTTGIQISGFIFDYSNRLGTAGQVLTSTASGVMWQADSSIVDLSSLSGQIAATGTLLNNRINSLSGYSDATFATITNLAATGSTLDTKINTLSGYSNANFATILNLATTGSTLDTKINTLSGYSNANFATVLNLAATGSVLDTKINTTNTNLAATGSTLDTKINTTNTNLAATGSTLDTKINTLSGYSNANFATVLNLAATGSTLNAKINSLSGYEIQTFLSGSGTQYYVPRWNTSKELVTGSIYDNGNVGIGTTSVGSPLEVYGTSMDPSLTASAASIFNVNSLGVELAIGRMVSPPFSLWLQGKHATLNSLAYPIVLNPLGGNVGIGTVSPTGVLTVQSNGTQLRLQTESGPGSYFATISSIYDATHPFTIAVANNSASTTEFFGIYADAGGANNRSVFPNGNVGIGTTSPSTKLEVQGNGQFGNDSVTNIGLKITRLNGGMRTSEHTYHSSQNSPWYTYGQNLTWTNELAGTVESTQAYRPYFEGFAPAAGYKVFGFMNVTTGSFTSTNVVNSLVLKNDGNVGIGTVSPTTLLSVGGAGSASAASGITFGADSQANLYRISSSRIKTDGNFTIDGQGGGATSLVLNRSSTSSENGMAFATAGSVDWYYYVDNGNNNLQIQRSSEIDTAPRVRFDGSNSNVLFNLGGGNVGIGVTNPIYKLQLQADNPNNGVLAQFYNYNAGAAGANGAFSIWTQYGIADWFIGQPSGVNALTFGRDKTSSATGVEYMRIDAGGNIGIGITNPSQKLDVNGSARFANIVYAAKGIFSDSAGVNPVLEVYNTVATNAATAIFRQTTAGGNGNQDIGLLVDIQGASDLDRIANFRYYDGSTYTSRMAIMRGGNVGIGTTNPSSKLTIYDHTNGATLNLVGRGSDDTAVINFRSSGDLSTYAYLAPDTNEFRTYHNDGFMSFYPGGSEKLRITAAGNVGIGVTNPGARLQVVNTGSITSISTVRIVGATGNGGGSQIEFFKGTSQKFSIGTASAITGGLSDDLLLTTLNPSSIILTAGLSGLAIFKTDGKVGIGMYDPISLLSVGGVGSTSAASGITFGGDASANLYRISSSRIKTDGSLEVAVGIISPTITSLSGNIAATGSTLDTKINTTNTNLAATGSTLDTKINTTNTNLAATGSTLNARINSLSGYAGSTFLSGQGVANWTARWNGTKELITGSIYDLGTGVGIGTTSPNSILDVYTVPATSGTLQPMLTLTSDFATAASVNFGSSIVFRGKTAGNVLQDNAQISAYNEDMGDNGYALAFFTRPTVAAGLTQRMTILRGGNVGIGTTSPNGIFHAANIKTLGTTADNFHGYFSSVNRNCNVYILAKNTEGSSLYFGDGDSNTVGALVYEHSANYLRVDVSGSERMRIVSDGKVGIGTVSPTTLLSVGPVGSTSAASGITLGGDASANLYRAGSSAIRTDGALIVASYLRSLSYIQLLTNIYADSYTDTLNINVGNTAANNWETAIKIKPGSYVGIGTTNPTGKLHVVSSVAGETVLRADGTNGTLFSVIDDLSDSLMSVNNSAGLPVLEVFADDRVVAGQYGSGDFVIINNKVGIGTTNPAYKLEVNGNFAAGGTSTIGTTYPQLTINGATNQHAYVVINRTNYEAGVQLRTNGTAKWYMYMPPADDTTLRFNSQAYGDSLTIKNNGNVGIGTTNPSFKLHTAGAGFIGRQNSYGSYDAADADLIISNYNSDNTSILLFNSAGAYQSSLINYYNNILSLGLNDSNSSNLILTSTSINITAAGVGIGTSVITGLLNVTRNSNTAQPIAFFKELYGSPAATNILLLERGNNLSAADQTSSNAGLRIRDHSSDYSLSIEDHNSNVNFAISGSKVLVGSRGTNSLLNVGGAGSVAAASGLTFGEDASANLYRSAASTIKTDGNLVVAGTTSLNGHTYGKKTVTLTTASYTTVLTVNLTAHTSCYVKIGAFGDWGSHSAVAFVSELFIQNGDNAGYAEPGTIITAHDNTAGAAGDKIDIQIVDPAAAGTQDFLIQLKLISASSSTYSSIITYHVMGQQASVT